MAAETVAEANAVNRAKLWQSTAAVGKCPGRSGKLTLREEETGPGVADEGEGQCCIWSQWSARDNMTHTEKRERAQRP